MLPGTTAYVPVWRDSRRSYTVMGWHFIWRKRTKKRGMSHEFWNGFTVHEWSFVWQYLIPWARIGAVRKDTQDPAIGKELWEWLEEQVKDIWVVTPSIFDPSASIYFPFMSKSRERITVPLWENPKRDTPIACGISPPATNGFYLVWPSYLPWFYHYYIEKLFQLCDGLDELPWPNHLANFLNLDTLLCLCPHVSLNSKITPSIC